MKKTTKAKRAAAKKKEAHEPSYGTLFKPGDFSKKRVGFPNLHLTIAAEAMKHAETARSGKAWIANHFRDVDRVLALAKKAGKGTAMHDALVALMNYCAQMLTVGESVQLHEQQALLGLDHIGQFVDMKQVRDAFHTKMKRAIYAELYPRSKRRGR